MFEHTAIQIVASCEKERVLQWEAWNEGTDHISLDNHNIFRGYFQSYNFENVCQSCLNLFWNSFIILKVSVPHHTIINILSQWSLKVHLFSNPETLYTFSSVSHFYNVSFFFCIRFNISLKTQLMWGIIPFGYTLGCCILSVSTKVSLNWNNLVWSCLSTVINFAIGQTFLPSQGTIVSQQHSVRVLFPPQNYRSVRWWRLACCEILCAFSNDISSSVSS